MEQAEIKQNKAIRGYIIRCLVKGFNNTALTRQISNSMMAAGLIISPDISKYLDYLQGAGYIEFTAEKVTAYTAYANDAVIKLTKAGVDLAEGTIEDAKLVSALTNDSSKLIKAISNIQYDGPRTDLQAGVNLAKESFSDKTDNSHKYIIVLSDGVPNVAINYDKNYYSDDVIAKTKAELQSLSKVTDNVYIMLTGISNGEATATPSTKTYNQIIESVFGTTEKPTIGKFYYVTDDKIETTITNDIYKDLLPVSKSFTNLKVTDYFTKEIVENFDFSYVKNPNIGTISDKIDTKTNSILWTIPELKSGETAIVQYKLKLKTNYSEDIINKVLNTNTKLDLSYTDSDNKTNTKSSDVTPKVKLTEQLPTVLPKAGSTIFFGFMGIVLVIATAFGIKYIVVTNSMK